MSTLIQNAISELQELDVPALRMRWNEAYGRPPPKRASRDLLFRALAYHVQVQASGGLRPTTHRRLTQTAREIASGTAPSPPTAQVKPGTRLLREWQGVTHEVIVLEDGVRYRGNTWPSLSAVAREITGTRWSGPLFFGLKGRRDGRR